MSEEVKNIPSAEISAQKQQEPTKEPPKKVVGRPFKPGESGNPSGKPKGTLSLSTKLKEALEKIWEGTANEAQELLIKRLLTNAVIKGDMRAIELIFDRIDGKVKEHFSGELRGFIGHGQIPEADMTDFVSDFVSSFKKKLHEKNKELGD